MKQVVKKKVETILSSEQKSNNTRGGRGRQLSSSEPSRQSSCPSHRTVTDTHVPSPQVNS